MERAAAIKKLGRILGKSLGYRVDPKAPDQDDRDEALAELLKLVPQREAARQEADARRAEILKADTEYQWLKAKYATAAKRCDELSATTRHYRFTVGVSNGMFFSVQAQGDSWEDVIAKLAEKQAEGIDHAKT